MRTNAVLVVAALCLPQSTADWSVGTPIPERIQEHHAAVLRGQIYVAGGLDSTGLTSAAVYRFDPTTNRWTRLKDLPGPRHHMPLVVVNDTLYALGGFSDRRFAPESSVWAYRASTDTWESRAPLPAPRGGSAAGVVDGQIILVGGFGLGRALLDTTVVYDPRTNRWRNA